MFGARVPCQWPVLPTSVAGLPAVLIAFALNPVAYRSDTQRIRAPIYLPHNLLEYLGVLGSLGLLLQILDLLLHICYGLVLSIQLCLQVAHLLGEVLWCCSLQEKMEVKRGLRQTGPNRLTWWLHRMATALFARLYARSLEEAGSSAKKNQGR